MKLIRQSKIKTWTKFVTDYRFNFKNTIKTLILSVILLFCIVSFQGCGTIKREPVIATTPSWMGTNQNSGFIGFTNGNYGVITPLALERYNLLIEKYGDRFLPPLKKNDGIISVPPNYWITPANLEYFVRMNRWYKTGVK